MNVTGAFRLSRENSFSSSLHIFHQMEQGVVPEAALGELHAVPRNQPSDEQLVITQYATVSEVQWA